MITRRYQGLERRFSGRMVTKNHSSSKQYHSWHRGHHGTSIIYKHVNMYIVHYCAIYTHMITYAYTHLKPFDKLHSPSLQTHTSHDISSSIFNLKTATSTGTWSLRVVDWFTMVDPSMLTPHPRFPTSSHQVTNSKVMWDEPRWIQHQHSSKNAVIGTPQLMGETNVWSQIVFECTVLTFCFNKTLSQNFGTISGWIWVKLVPKFHLAIWPFQETVAEEWLQLHYPSGSIWFVRLVSWWTCTITIHHSNKWGMKTHPNLHPPASFQMAYSP